MFAKASGTSQKQEKRVNGINYLQLLVCAVALSLLLHAFIAWNWRSPGVEPLATKSPQVLEVELIQPKLPEPVVKPKPIEKPKPIVKPVVKPKPVEKPKPKPKAEPKPVQSKAPPKVIQKTFTEAAPVVKESKPTYSPVPVFGTPTAKPSKSTVSSTATKPVVKPAPAAHSGGGGNSGLQVLQRIPPKYPARALSRHMEGHVTVQFTVNASGNVEGASVTSASPAGVFEEAALANIRQWKFKPKMVNGTPVSQRAVQTINFKLN